MPRPGPPCVRESEDRGVDEHMLYGGHHVYGSCLRCSRITDMSLSFTSIGQWTEVAKGRVSPVSVHCAQTFWKPWSRAANFFVAATFSLQDRLMFAWDFNARHTPGLRLDQGAQPPALGPVSGTLQPALHSAQLPPRPTACSISNIVVLFKMRMCCRH